MFEKGELVVYGNTGVCKIEDITHVDLPGAAADRLYYVMRPVQENAGVVYLPTDNQNAVIRRIMTREEAEDLIRDIPSIQYLIVTEEKKREANYKEALRSCDSRTWVSIIKTLHDRKKQRISAGKKITSLDERYLRAAEQELYGELSVVLGIPKKDMEEYLQGQTLVLS